MLLSARIDERDRVGLAASLVPGFRGDYCHDRMSFDRVVLRSHVFNDDVEFHVATFLTVTDGLITRLVEVWTDDIPTPEENQ